MVDAYFSLRDGVQWVVHDGTPADPKVQRMMAIAFCDYQNVKESQLVEQSLTIRDAYMIHRTPLRDEIHLYPERIEEKRKKEKIKVPYKSKKTKCAIDVFMDDGVFCGIVLCMGEGFNPPYKFVSCEMFDSTVPDKQDVIFPIWWHWWYQWESVEPWKNVVPNFDVTKKTILKTGGGDEYKVIPCDSWFTICTSAVSHEIDLIGGEEKGIGISPDDYVPEISWSDCTVTRAIRAGFGWGTLTICDHGAWNVNRSLPLGMDRHDTDPASDCWNRAYLEPTAWDNITWASESPSVVATGDYKLAVYWNMDLPNSPNWVLWAVNSYSYETREFLRIRYYLASLYNQNAGVLVEEWRKKTRTYPPRSDESVEYYGQSINVDGMIFSLDPVEHIAKIPTFEIGNATPQHFYEENVTLVALRRTRWLYSGPEGAIPPSYWIGEARYEFHYIKSGEITSTILPFGGSSPIPTLAMLPEATAQINGQEKQLYVKVASHSGIGIRLVEIENEYEKTFEV